jgi:hypothetical protein
MAMLRGSRLTSESGSSLIITIMLLMVVSGLVAAIIASSMTDTLVARNHHSGAQAQAAAEAGLNHAIDASRAYLRDWESNFDNTNDAVSRVLRGPDDLAGTPSDDADNGSLAWITNGTPTPPATLTLAALNGVRYEARVYDDDDPALLNGWTAADMTRAKVLEGHLVSGVTVADPTVDRNGIFVVRATGYAQDNTAVTVEALMKPCPWPAIVTNGNLDMSGGPSVLGDGGSVHANGNITEVGNAATVQHDVTAVGTVTTNSGWTPVQGIAEGGQLPIPIPPVNVADYLSLAQYRLGSDGGIYVASTGVAICTTNATCAAKGFTWSSQAMSKVSHMVGIVRTWDPGGTPDCATLNASLAAAGIAVPNCGQGVYYAQASDVDITGNLGRTGTPAPYALTLLVDGSVSISGTPHIVPAVTHPGTLLVTNGDLVMTGTANCKIRGQARVREQFKLAGTMELTGQVIVESRYDLSDAVTGDSQMSGNATVTNDKLAVYDFAVAGWREFRR